MAAPQPVPSGLYGTLYPPAAPGLNWDTPGNREWIIPYIGFIITEHYLKAMLIGACGTYIVMVVNVMQQLWQTLNQAQMDAYLCFLTQDTWRSRLPAIHIFHAFYIAERNLMQELFPLLSWKAL